MVMQARSSAVLLAGVMSGVTLSLLCVTGALLWESQSLQRQLVNAVVEANELRAQQKTAESEMATQRSQLATLADEVRQLRDAPASNAAGTSPDAPNATRAQIFAGNRLVGLGWVIGTSPNGHAASRVVLDPPSQAVPQGQAQGEAEEGGARSLSSASFAYQYQTSTYGWGYPWLYTYGWIDWPVCTNLPPDEIPAGPGVTPPAETAPPPASPAPVVASRPFAAPQPWRPRLPQVANYPSVPRTVGVMPQRSMAPALARTATPMASPRIGVQPTSSRLPASRPGLPATSRAPSVPRR